MVIFLGTDSAQPGLDGEAPLFCLHCFPARCQLYTLGVYMGSLSIPGLMGKPRGSCLWLLTFFPAALSLNLPADSSLLPTTGCGVALSLEAMQVLSIDTDIQLNSLNPSWKDVLAVRMHECVCLFTQALSPTFWALSLLRERGQATPRCLFFHCHAWHDTQHGVGTWNHFWINKYPSGH